VRPPLEDLPPLSDGIVRVVVVSDLHAVPTGAGSVIAEDTAGNVRQNALTAATDLLVSKRIKADVLACPGDLIDIGVAKPLPWVWDELQRMATELGASLVASVGNHDLDRRPAPSTGPQTSLRALRPRFPGPGPLDPTKYWGDGFTSCRSTDGRWRVITVDTCQLVGYHPENEQWGVLREDTLELLEEFLGDDEPARVNLLMCHHQPQEWTHPNDTTTSHLQRGDLLLGLLDKQPERWMLLHGHKHEPVLDYFGHGTGGSVRFAAASVGANVAAEPNITNQIHVLDFHLDSAKLGMPLAGEVWSIDWHQGYGWEAPTVASALVERAGFGFRRDGAELAWWLESHYGSATVDWDTVAALDPRVRYLVPRDLAALIAAVKEQRTTGSGVSAGSVRTNRETGQIEELTLR